MIVGLGCQAQVGKDTAGQFLVERGFTRLAFADTLKEVVYALNPLVDPPDRVQDLVDRFGWEEAKKVPEVRQLLQRMGTEAGRNILGQNIWVDAVMNKATWAGIRDYVITDVRFPNEFEAIRQAGGYLIKIEREGGGAGSHASETALENAYWDYTIENNDSLKTFEKNLVHVLGLKK